MTASDGAKARRLVLIDAWRFVAAAAIVWLHTCNDGYLTATTPGTRFAVPFFTAAAMYLLYQSERRRPEMKFGAFFARRVQRLYLPFLGWNAVYLASSDLKRHFLSHQPPLPLDISYLFWAGTSLQLWFLPFLLVATLAGFWICRWMVRGDGKLRNRTTVLLILIGLVFCFFVMPLSGQEKLEQGTPIRFILALIWDTLPAAFWGLALAAWPRRPPAWIGLGGFLAATAAGYLVGCTPLSVNLAGLCALIAACGDWDSPLIRKLAQFGLDAYGIYLAHVLFIEAMFAGVQYAKIPNSIPLKLGEFAVALAASMILVRLLTQSRWTSWMNGHS
jgi:peptidoglycan/LPS O-acetylase OafA/YrhL